MESPTSKTLTGLVEVAATGSAGDREDAVVVAEVGPVTASWEPCSPAAPTGTSVLTKTALMARAAPTGAATQERHRFSAPRRTGISTRS